jgi:hypothetical protein
MQKIVFILAFLMSIFLHSHETCFADHSQLFKLNKKQPHRYLLITGCGHSGTLYIAKVLQLCGLKINHEADGEDGIVSWFMAAPSKSAPFGPGGKEFQFVHIFHQVRDPLKVIASICKEPAKGWLYISRHVPEITMDEPLLGRAAKYYYYWNRMAEKKAQWTYRIEDIENVMDEMGRRLGIRLDKKAIQKVPKNTHSHRVKKSYTWADIRAAVDPDLYRKLVKMARRYGYQVNE